MNDDSNTRADRWRRYGSRYRLFSGPFHFPAWLNLGLLILLFVILSSDFVLQPGIQVDIPVAAQFASGVRYSPFVVTLTQEGLAFFDDEQLPLENLAAAFIRRLQQNRDWPLTIEADSRVPYGTIVRVMNMAAVAGFRDINLAVTPAPIEEVSP